MAVPKKKPSHARTFRRKRANEKRELPNLTKCPSCESYILPHRACPKCGNYKGRNVLEIKTE